MSTRTLTRQPALAPLFARAGLGAIPGAASLPFVGRRSARPGEQVSDTVLTLDGVTVDRDRLAAYDRVCGFDLSDTLPATYPHMLVFALHLLLMTAPDFPVAAIGLVHLHNRIEQHRPITVGETLDLKVWATPLYPHPRGRQFMLRSEVRVGEELVWEEASLNLKRGHRDDSIEGPAGPPETDELPISAQWRLPADLGRRYAAVSGDINPIHMHALTARAFGFPAAIAHGMWTKARCLAQLGPELPETFTVEVAFRRPILLPATVAFAEARNGAGLAFGVRDARGDTPHIDGLLSVR